jgi:flagellar motor switch protein FliG
MISPGWVGIETTVNILNSIDRSTEKFILESLESHDEELVEEIRSKMFLFEDIVKLDKLSIQRVLKEVNNDELVLALKGVKPQVSEYIFENMSKRLQEMIKDEMSIKGPVKLRDVEEAQQKIVMAIRRLDEAEKSSWPVARRSSLTKIHKSHSVKWAMSGR